MFYFVRHGKTDYSQKNTMFYQGWGTQLAPLSETGVAQIERTAQDERLRGAELILSSPYTRAVHTAAILSRALGAPIAIDTGPVAAFIPRARKDAGRMRRRFGRVCAPCWRSTGIMTR